MSFWFFICFFVSKFDVCLLVLVLYFFAYGRSKQTRSLLLLSLRMHGMQSVAFIIGFIYGQSVFFQII